MVPVSLALATSRALIQSIFQSFAKYRQFQFVIRQTGDQKRMLSWIGKSKEKGFKERCFRQGTRIETREHSDKGRLFQRMGAQQLKVCDPVAVLTLGAFSSKPWFDLRVLLGVAIINMSWNYDGCRCPICSARNARSLILQVIPMLTSSQRRG